MGHSEALLQFLLSEGDLLCILGLCVKLNHTLVFTQHAVKDPHFTAFLKMLSIESFLWSLAFFDHPHLDCVNFLCSAVDLL